ncbi:MAG: FecR domain-containing protein [Planctomycetia bacterium]|nr:FecR domain-containing protein [Planctomycetia bacterium]
MSNTPRPYDADRQLIDALLDDALESAIEGSPLDTADLLARLERDSTVCDYLVERAVLHAGLRHSLRRRSLASWAIAGAQADAAITRRRSRTSIAWLAVAACLAVAFGGWQIWSRPYATVTMGIGTTGLATGQNVRNEMHDLAAGVLELETRRGVQIVIEAPAAFQFETPQRLRLTDGRIAADVPARAKGFTVVTPTGEAIDLGTRFAVDVPASGAAEVHVFDGEVIARGGAHTTTNLRDGEAFSLATNAARELRTAAFIRGGEVAELAAAFAAGQDRSSRAAIQRLRDDQSLIAVIDFEGDESASVDRPASPGQYRVVQGRWPGSQAADFTNVGDHLPLDVGGDTDWPQLTVAAWVRLDRLGEPYQSLYHTDGWTKQNPGQVHWMIVDSGVMRLALPGWKLGPGAVEQHGHPESRTSVLGTEGRWMHLAFVYDSTEQTARCYVDGRPDGETPLVDAPPARLGPARIGNWNRQDRKLSGRIDELVFVGRALSADEIRGLFEAGVPYRPRTP